MNNTLLLPRLGIVGGAGPMAGALLFQKIVQIAQSQYGCQTDADFPWTMLLSYPFADMLKNPLCEKQHQLVKEQLTACFSTFAQNGITLAAIACNTLHTFLDPSITQGIPLVHMIAETGSLLKQRSISHTFVLCSTTSARCQLHKAYFDCRYPDDAYQDEIQGLINTLLAGQQRREDAQKLSEQLNARLSLCLNKEEETVGLVLGCTEFSVFNEQFPMRLNGLDERILVFDPNQIVAEKLCALIFNNKTI